MNVPQHPVLFNYLYQLSDIYLTGVSNTLRIRLPLNS